LAHYSYRHPQWQIAKQVSSLLVRNCNNPRFDVCLLRGDEDVR